MCIAALVDNDVGSDDGDGNEEDDVVNSSNIDDGDGDDC